MEYTTNYDYIIITLLYLEWCKSEVKR